MKRKIVVILLGIICLIPAFLSRSESRHSTYPALLQVISCEGSVQEGFQVKLKSSQGFVYTCTWEDGDMDTGDFYACIIDDMGTACIYDDTVVQAQYIRIDMY